MAIKDMGKLMTGYMRFEIRVHGMPEDEIKALMTELRATARRRDWRYNVNTPMIWTDGEWDGKKDYSERPCRAEIFGEYDSCTESALAEVMHILQDYDVAYDQYRIWLEMQGGLKRSELAEEVPF